MIREDVRADDCQSAIRQITNLRYGAGARDLRSVRFANRKSRTRREGAASLARMRTIVEIHAEKDFPGGSGRRLGVMFVS